MGRKDRDKKADLSEQPDTHNFSESSINEGIGKRILILVEGETEKNYFTGIKGNVHLRLASVVVEVGGSSLPAMLWIAMSRKKEFNEIWLVFDNDKRNAFVLRCEDEPTEPNNNVLKNLPIGIAQKIKGNYQENIHSYFLSIYDYLQWLGSFLNIAEILEYWDKIQHNTTKNQIFECFQDTNPYVLFLESKLFKNKKYINIDKIVTDQFDVQWKSYTKMAYSAIAFEFWLILHFERNKTPFIWDEKGKPASIDVFSCFQTWRSDYGKGDADKKEKKNNSPTKQDTAYKSLFDINAAFSNKTTEGATLDEQRKVLFRIIRAYCNARWLRKEMQPILERQNNNWYEVNPYIKGLDELIGLLLNIKHCNEEIEYFDWVITFDFQSNILSLKIANKVLETQIINNNHQSNFEIINASNELFEPTNIPTTKISDVKETTLEINFDIPIEKRTNLVLFFKDPRKKSLSTPLIVLLNEEPDDDVKHNSFIPQ